MQLPIMILAYVLSHTTSELSRCIGQIIYFDGACLYLTLSFEINPWKGVGTLTYSVKFGIWLWTFWHSHVTPVTLYARYCEQQWIPSTHWYFIINLYPNTVQFSILLTDSTTIQTTLTPNHHGHRFTEKSSGDLSPPSTPSFPLLSP